MFLNSIFDKVVKTFLLIRNKRIEKEATSVYNVQEKIRKRLVSKAKFTEYGKLYQFNKIKTRKDFIELLPIVHYDLLLPYIQKMMMGERDVLWPGAVTKFAKTAGTSTGRSKYIPVSKDFLQNNMVKSSWDSVSFIYNHNPQARLFADKTLLMGGSLEKYEENKDVLIGDVSALMISAMPPAGRPFFTPDFETALLADWEEKIENIATICMKENVVMFGGVPPWLLVLFNKMLEKSGKNNMTEIWPNAHSYMHGGVGFEPYLEQFKRLFPGGKLAFWEVYNASEGYLAMSNNCKEEGMLLLINNDVYFEFIKLNDYNGGNFKSLNITEVELDENYVLVISTSAGLWRYVIGDTIKFVKLNPYKIKVTGRISQYINVFGEELMVQHAEIALKYCCDKHHCEITNFTVGPVFIDGINKGKHQWLIEFKTMPADIYDFSESLDRHIRKINSDYDAKRTNDFVLSSLIIEVLPKGTFLNWFNKNDKIGGQNKVVRLSNDRDFIEEIYDAIVKN